MDFLRGLNVIKQQLKPSTTANGCLYYDFETNSNFKFEIEEFNTLLDQYYDSEFLARRNLIYNKLYLEIYRVYQIHYQKYNYSYNQDLFNETSLISKFIHGLRWAHSRDQNSFELYVVLSYEIFDSAVTVDQYYKFLLNFVLLLQEHSIIEFYPHNYTIKIAEKYFEDAKKLMNLSFHPFYFGYNKMYENTKVEVVETEYKIQTVFEEYTKFPPERRMYLQDQLSQYVIVSATDKVFIDSGANNTLHEFFQQNKTINIL